MILIDDVLLAEFRARTCCEFCGKRAVCQPHHLFTRGMGSGGRLDIRLNLMALCGWCHHSHHYSNRPSRRELLKIVAKREGVSTRKIIQSIWDALRTPK